MCRRGEEGRRGGEKGLRNIERPILRKYTYRLRRARDVHQVALFGRYCPLVALSGRVVLYLGRGEVIIKFKKHMWVQLPVTILF